MKVWAGCEACWDDRTYMGRWVEAELLPTLDPYEEHQLEAYAVTVPEKHLKPMKGYQISDFGVPDPMAPDLVTLHAQLFDALTEIGAEYSAWLMAAWMLNREPWEVTPGAFKGLYAGQWTGRPTRALKRRYSLTRAGDGHYYMWRR